MTTLVERSGGTPTEARCIAEIVGRGAASMSEAFQAGRATKNDAPLYLHCILSEARQLTLGKKLEAIVTRIDPQFAHSVYQP